MHIYLAAVYSNTYMNGQSRYQHLTDHEKQIADNIPNILESYHYVHKQQFVDAMRENGAKVFVDSGAFSAFTLGTEIDLPGYCDYLKRNNDIVRYEDGVMLASVLDGIGDPLKTYQNQKAMESLGVTPLPCFHVGEDERYLEYYMEHYEYITLGGMVPYSSKQLFVWLDRIWNKYLTDGSGNAKIKVHGFGLTSPSLMKSYPWYSCDSSSWIQVAAFGNVYNHDKGVTSISEKSPSRHTAGQHFTNLKKLEQGELEERFNNYGFTSEQLSKRYESRAIYNILSFQKLNDYINSSNETKSRLGFQELF